MQPLPLDLMFAHSLMPLIVATVPSVGGYVNPVKIAVVLFLLFGWAAGMQWVDRDTDVVKTKREHWNLIVISGALAGYVVLFLPPWGGGLFVLGIAFWLVLAGGSMLAYVIHRNGRVLPAAKVMTIRHFKRLVLGDPNKKKQVEDKGQVVRLADCRGEPLERPDDPEEASAFYAVQDFLHDLLWHRVSEAEIRVGRENYRLICRVDGVASERPGGLPVEDGERIVRYLKRIAGLNVEEIRRPQTGTIQAALLSHDGDAGPTEVHTSGTTAGERMRLRIQAGPTLMRIHELGLPPQRLELLKKAILGKPTGLLLMSAPPQNGLTTTQYAVLRSHDAYMHHIHTLERRAAIELDNITQHVFESVNTDINYARMLQTVIRREPDIIMVSDCEDRETAQIATRAAADNRKIYLGIQASDAFAALKKYLAFVEDNRLAAKALCGVINNRLVRKLCTQCREAFKPDSATLKKLNLPADKIDRFYRPPSEPKLDRKGKEIICPNCQGSGYLGRTSISELLVVDENVAKLIAEGAPVARIKAQCRKNKMYYLQEEGLLKVIDGTTSMNEVLRIMRGNGK